MKKLILERALMFSAVLLLSAANVMAQNVTVPAGGGNQKASVTQYIGPLVSVSITYNSPDVHAPNGDDRTGKIWGQLVPYGLTDLGFGLRQPAPWRAGANQNTIITFSHDVLVEGKPIKAGTYGLHVIVNENNPWTVIFSNNSTAWGSFFYEEKDDALRVDVNSAESAYTEWLTFDFIDRQPNSTTAALKWENKMVPFKIEVENINELYVANMRKELQSTAGFTWQGWNQAANFCLTNDINLEEALTWADASISAPFIGQANFTNLSTKSQIQAKLGKTKEAAETMDLAVNHPTATAFQVHAYGRRLIASGDKAKALEVFKLNHKNNDGAWPTNYGLARAYSANGNYKAALKYLKIAKTKVPQGDTINPPVIETNIKKLEKGEDIN